MEITFNNRGNNMRYVERLLDYSDTWSEDDVYFFTANQVVKRDGCLVMGAGNAKSCAMDIPCAPFVMGQVQELTPKQLHIVTLPDNRNLGSLATKVHFKDKSDLDFVKEGLFKLYELAKATPNTTFHVPYPAIGKGGLKRSQLDHIVESLPSNVRIYLNPQRYYNANS
jgi:hypothetical protein